MKNKKEKKIAIFLDTRKQSGGEYQHLIYTINNLKVNNKNGYKFLIICLSKSLNLELEKKFDIEVKYFSLNSFERYINYLRNHNSLVRRVKKYFFKNKFELFLKKNNVDIIYFTSPSQYSLYLEDTKFLITVPDVDHRHHIEFPEAVNNSEFERKNEIFSKALPKALAIFTNAKIIKERLKKYYNISEERVYIINLRPAHSVDNFVYEKDKHDYYNKKFNLSEGYIYYPAMYLPHKNHKTVIDVIKLLKERHKLDFKAVFSGGDVGYKKDLLKYCEKSEIKQNIIFLDFVEDDALPYLYKNAFALLFPVLMGPTFTPLWEAFKLEIPVIFSELEGTKDVYGDAVIYVDPFNVEELALAVKRLKNDKMLIKDLTNKGKLKIDEINKKNEYKQIFEVIDNYRKISKTWDMNN